MAVHRRWSPTIRRSAIIKTSNRGMTAAISVATIDMVAIYRVVAAAITIIRARESMVEKEVVAIQSTIEEATGSRARTRIRTGQVITEPTSPLREVGMTTGEPALAEAQQTATIAGATKIITTGAAREDSRTTLPTGLRSDLAWVVHVGSQLVPGLVTFRVSRPASTKAEAPVGIKRPPAAFTTTVIIERVATEVTNLHRAEDITTAVPAGRTARLAPLHHPAIAPDHGRPPLAQAPTRAAITNTATTAVTSER